MHKRCHFDFRVPVDAIIPTYDKRGNNMCQVICSKGTTTPTQTSVSKFLQLWFQFMRIDLYAQRMWTQEVLNTRNLNPIVINEKAVFIPIKFRHSVGDKDGCYGYVRLQSIRRICSESIYLNNGIHLPYLSTVKTIKNKIKDGKLLAYLYIEERKVHDMIYRGEDII